MMRLSGAEASPSVVDLERGLRGARAVCREPAGVGPVHHTDLRCAVRAAEERLSSISVFL